MRKVIQFNEGWSFSKTREIPECFPEDWEEVTLPHTWNAKDGQDGGNDYYRGTCTYIKKFPKPLMEEGGRAFLEFHGAAMTAHVRLNGREVKVHEGGYSLFRADITEELSEENLLCVSVDNGSNNRVYPQMADFTFYGGIYRDVNLITVAGDHFELEKDGTSGIRVTPIVTFTDCGNITKVTCEAWVTGGRAVRFFIEPAKGTEGKESERKGTKGKETQGNEVRGKGTEEEGVEAVTIETPVKDSYAGCEITMENAHLWDGIRDPYLYTLRAELLSEDGTGIVRDTVSTRFGCRKFELDPQKGFFLNGREYPLRGVSRHQDREGVGSALTMKMHREDMELIREMGVNSIRLAHYQHAQEFYDLCDEAGMIVWAEIPFISAFMEKGRENTLSQMRELVTQCYNHPCIYCWGLSNEITAAGDVTEELLENHRELNRLCHEMDATRLTAMAHIFTVEKDSPLIPVADIGAYNLYFGWYRGELTDNEAFLDEYHAMHPDRCLGFSEFGADSNIRFQNGNPKPGDYSEGYQALFHEHMAELTEKRSWLFGAYVWNMFDFAADGREDGGIPGRNLKGLVTFDRKVKKDAFYLYKACWSPEPFVHLCGSRYVDRAEEVTEVKVYSNQPSVTLYVDGKMVEKREAKKVFVFRVPINGEHTVRAEAEGLWDEIRIRRVTEGNPEYVFQKAEVHDWFEQGINPNYYSVNDTMGEIMGNPRSASVYAEIMGKWRTAEEGGQNSSMSSEGVRKMIENMTVARLAKRSGMVPPEALEEINAALQKIRKGGVKSRVPFTLSVAHENRVRYQIINQKELIHSSVT